MKPSPRILAGLFFVLPAMAFAGSAIDSIEALGRALFFDVNLSSNRTQACATCHAPEHAFVDPRPNNAARAVNGSMPDHVDRGLLDHPQIDDARQAGRFKTPTLRNVDVTGPYLHKGAFAELRPVVLFYNKYNSKSSKRQINRETGRKWRAPEVAENLSLEELETGPALKDRRIDALVAFMKTLTDARCEHLLDAIR